MNGEEQVELDGFDRLLIVIIGVLLVVCFIVLLPALGEWGWRILNIRGWPRWLRLVGNLAALAVLLGLRIGPSRRSKEANQDKAAARSRGRLAPERRATLLGLDSAGWIWLVIVALLLSGTYLLLSSPARCDWWIEKLDVRNWSAAMWTGVSLAFAFVALCGWLAAVQNAKPEEDFISKWKLRAVGLNVLLGLAAVGLPAQMCWPAIDAWQNRPRPGMQVAQQYLTKGDDNTGTAEVRYLLYLPEGYGESRRWPLVVFLHGEEGGGENLELVRQTGLPKLIERHSGVVSYGVKPSQALPNGQPSSGGPTKFTGLRNSFVLLSPQCPADSQWTPQLVLELIEHICSSLSIDRERVYVTGYRMGGSGAWEVASQDPGRFAALVSVCGGRAGDVERLKNVSVWLFEEQKNAGANWESSETVEALRAGGGEVQFTACPAGPATCDSVYRTRELYEWLFAQKRHQ